MKTLAMALITFREAIRNKILYTLIFFAFLFTGMVYLLSNAILGGRIRIITGMGLANIEVFCTMIAIFVGITLVYKELERRTIYVILSRPVPRYQIILGKFLGLMLTLLLELVIMSAVFLALVLLYDGVERVPGLALAIGMIGVKVALITAVAVLFSTVSTPILSGMFTLAFYVASSFSGYFDMLLTSESPPWLGAVVRALQFVVPDFRFLDIKGEVIYQHPLDMAIVGGGIAYGLLYTTIVLLLAMLIFERKDLK